MNHELYVKTSDLKSMFVNYSVETEKFEYVESRLEKRLFGLIPPKQIEAGWFCSNGDSITEEEILSRYIIDENKSVFYKPYIRIIFYSRDPYTLEFNSDDEAKEWINSFVRNNSLYDDMLVITKNK